MSRSHGGSSLRSWVTACVIGALLCADGIVAGWMTRLAGLFGGDGHLHLGERALQQNLVPANEYPDLQRFRPRLLEGAASEDGHPSMFLNIARGDGLQQDWSEVSSSYSGKDFTHAYLRLGIMGHLVQDMASPAHAFDIPHSSYLHTWIWPETYKDHKWGDNMEWYADQVFAPTMPPAGLEFTDPVDAYSEMRLRTRNVVVGSVDNPPLWAGPRQPRAQDPGTEKWRFYWRLRPGGPAMVLQSIPGHGRSTDSFPGEYGPNRFPRGPNGMGVIPEPRRPERSFGAPKYPEGWHATYYIPFLNRRLGDAVAYSSACWRAASRKLPPILIRHPSRIDGNTIEVIENRKKEVDLKMFINGVLSDDYDGAVDVLESAPEEPDPANPTHLPWQRAFPVHVPNLPPGHYTLRWEVRDIPDGNVGVPFEETLNIGNIFDFGG